MTLSTCFVVGNGVFRTLNGMLANCTIPTPLSIGAQAKQIISCKLHLQQCTLEVGTRQHKLRHLQATLLQRQTLERVLPMETSKVAMIVLERKLSNTMEIAKSMATVHLHIDKHLSGYLTHPAVLDSCLHGGLALVPQGTLEHAHKTQIPTGLAAYILRKPLVLTSNAYVIIQVHKSPSAMLLSNSYHMQQDHGMRQCGFNVIDLHIQEMRRNSLQRKDVDPFNPWSKQLSYLISWQHSKLQERERGIAKGSAEMRMHTWSENHTIFFIGRLPSASQATIASSLMDVGTVQKVVKGSSSTLDLSLLTTGHLGHDDIAPPRHVNLAHKWSDIDFEKNAAALATIKVAASEHPQHTWSAIISDPFSKVLTATHKGVDAFGMMLHGGVIKTPHILMAKQEMVKPAIHVNRYPKLLSGETLIAGGLGGKLLQCLTLHSSTCYIRFDVHT